MVTDISKVNKVEDLAEKTKKLSPEAQKIVREVTQITIDSDTDFGVSEPRDIESPLSINVQLAKKDEFIQAIRNVSADILRAKAEERAAKEMLNEEIEQLDGWTTHEEAKEEAARTNAELKAQMIESEEVETATENYQEKSDTLARHKAILSDLLVLYAAKFNSKTVEVEREQPRLILLSAKIGKVEVEQLRLF